MHLDFISQYCRSLPAATEDIKWGHDLCFSIGEKMFCVISLEAPHTFSFKVADDEFETLSVTNGFIPAPYMARSKWVLVNDPSVCTRKQWEKYIFNSYEMIKSKLTAKKRAELGVNK